MKLQSYLMGEWREGQGEGVPVRDASTGEVLARVTAEGLPVRRFLRSELYSIAGSELGVGAEAVRARVTALGASLGPPWTSDEKEATAAAWLVLAGLRNGAA